MSARTAAIVACSAALLAAGLAACGKSPEAGGPTPAPTSSSPAATASGVPVPSPSGSGPVVSPPPRTRPSIIKSPQIPPPARDQSTVVGTVVYKEVEGGCLGLTEDGTGKTYELVGGDHKILSAGARVRVVGILRTDMATVCQIGMPLQVVSAERL
ncbi:hypothetical protein [Hamadaea tsunoensis]|uniref:hypothetical protein n=1 Tax=Hamadaea tsunoensis TaxID=53368 RepID=UPI0004010A50|nr:hypothetical protein [Hamadaea tsunoensis]